MGDHALLEKLGAYTRMKGSGVDWMGAVPEPWQVRPNRALFEEINVREHPEEQMLSVTIKNGVVPQKLLLEDSSKKDSSNQDRSAYKLVSTGDIVYNKMRAWQGAIGLSQYKGIVSPAYVVQRPRGVLDGKYVEYLFRTPAFAKEAERWSYGITSDMWSLRPEHFKMIYACVPPPDEQRAIVRFLDHMDRKIRKYIRAKQKLIKLLEEQKQAIIHRAVTRGLDPNVRLKPSGVEWLGDVPEHWEVVPLKRRVGFQEGPGIMAADFREHGVPLLRISCLLSSGDPLAGCNFLDPEKVRTKWNHFLVQPGNYILNASTSASTVRIFHVKERWIGCVPYTGLIRMWALGTRVSMAYVALLFGSSVIQEQLLQARTGVGIAHFGPSHLKRLWLALPPFEEQVLLLSELEAAIYQFERGVAIAQQEISLIREYRTRLFTDVVTGKLDVCEAAMLLEDVLVPGELPEEREGQDEADEDVEATELTAVSEETDA